jgi:hypothetical protein
MSILVGHSGMECRNPGAKDDNAINANALADFGIHAVWMPAIPAGMTNGLELE